MENWTAHDPLEHASQLINSFHNAWDDCAKPGLIQYNRWWNESCRSAKARYNEVLSQFSRAAFLRQCKLAKKEYFTKKINEMVKSQKSWEGTGWIKQRSLPKVPQIVANGQVLNDLDQMFDKMHEQFMQSATTPAISDVIDELPQQDQQSWPEFSSLELDDALLTCSNASAPGPSHFSWEYIKIFLKDDTFRAFFLHLANNIVSLGVWPDIFKISTMVIIPKPKKEDYSKAKSYRPIALLECPGKLISKLIANRLQSDITIFDIPHPLQFGGRKHHSTLDAGLFIMEYITKARNNGLYTTTLALDVAQFFPSLDKNIIISILTKEGFNPAVTRLFESYYEERSTKYLWNNHFYKDYEVDNGVPQGDPLSPVISILYMSAMLRKLFPFDENRRSQCLSYIDDFVLITASPSLDDNIDMLEDDFIRLSRALILWVS